MRRSILLALVAALALAVGVNATASATAADDGAQATAKKKAGKKKAAKCPAKPKKGKKKAGKSLADSAAKKKGKKKASKCKAKPKKKAKAKPKTPAAPKGPTSPQPPPPGTVFGDGTYKDGAKSFQVQVLNNGQNVDVGFTLPASNGCPGIGALMGSSEPLTRSATQAHASESFNVAGIVQVTWDLTVQLPSLSYVLKIDSEFSTPPCTGQTTYQGTLVKQ